MAIKVVELFAGVGGFRLGLERSSKEFEFVWANQWEPGKKLQHAFNCYIHHFGESENHVNDDIAKVKHLVPEHDLLVGGFPCQDYSVAATGARGIQGKKGVLWWEIRDIVEAKRPSLILLENVDRLIKSPSSQRGRDFGVMLKSLDELGYTVEWRVINAAEYGLAQRRRRIFIFAYRENTGFYSKSSNSDLNKIVLNNGFFATAFPVVQSEKKQVTKEVDLREYDDLVSISDTFKREFKNSGIMKEGKVLTIETVAVGENPTPLRNILLTGEVDEKYFLGSNISKWEYLKGAKKIARKKPNGEDYNYSEGPIAFPDPIDKPARTMLTSESSVNRSTHVVEDLKTGKLRVLTEIECERLNGFEDDWTNTGMPSKFRYFTMGNALVVPLVERMGKDIADGFETEMSVDS